MNCNFITSEAFLFYNNKIYASDMNKNGLFVYDQIENQGIFGGLFPNENSDSIRIHSNAHLIDNKIWFIPDCGKYIHIVNPDNNEIESIIGISKDDSVRTEYSYFINNKIVLFQNNNKIRIYSIVDKDFTSVEIPFMSEKAILRRDISVEGDDVYFVNNLDKVVYKLNTEDNRIEATKIDCNKDVEKGFGTIVKTGDYYWLSTQNGIVKYNSITKEYSFFDQFPDGYSMRIINNKGTFQEIQGFADVNKNGEQPFSASIKWNNNIIFFPSRVNTCIQINPENDELKAFQLPDEQEDGISLKQRERITHNHYLIRNENGTNYVTSTKTRRIYVFDNDENYHYHLVPFNEVEWTFEAGKGVSLEGESGMSDFINYLLR